MVTPEICSPAFIPWETKAFIPWETKALVITYCYVPLLFIYSMFNFLSFLQFLIVIDLLAYDTLLVTLNK